MSEATAKLSDEELFLSHIVELVDGELAPSIKEKVETYSKNNSNKVEDFKRIRGKLQMSLQPIYLTEDELLELRRYVRNENDRHNLDELRIDEVARKENWSYWRRQLFFVAMTAAVIFAGIKFFSPEKKAEFDALQSLAYEAIAMEDSAESRLDFPTDSYSDVQDFFGKNKQLEANPPVLKPHDQSWVLKGAGVIDYDVAFISVVEYENAPLKESIFHFTYLGQLSDLSQSEQGEVDGFKYQAYGSDKINVITWQQSEGLVSMLVGHRAADQLAKIVKTGTFNK
jgi:hypothetical protein